MPELEDELRITLAGQWFGYFNYGPEYGEILENKQVTFSILFEEVFNNQFKGKCIELDGMGASPELSSIEGFLKNNFISFTKEYPTDNVIDEKGNAVTYEGRLNPMLCYEGQFNHFNQSFTGYWEIRYNEVSAGEGVTVDICTGNWEMSKDAAKYGI